MRNLLYVIAKSGFRVYVVDQTGNVVSPVKDLLNQEPSYMIGGFTTRVGSGNTNPMNRSLKPSEMPLPFIHSGSFQGNGQAVRQWMRSPNSSGEQNVKRLIYDYLGEDTYNLFKDTSTNYYLILEPIAWHDIYTGNSASSNTGIGFYGTFYNWMQMYNSTGLENGGFTKQLDNDILGTCLSLVKNQPEFDLVVPTTTGLLNLTNVGNQGFGMQIYWNNDLGDSTHTWDSTHHLTDEAPAPDPTEENPDIPSTDLIYTIIKSYRLRDSQGNLTDKGTYTRTQTVASILIEDEPLNTTDKNYKVIGWKHSSTKKSNISSLVWESTVPPVIGTTGTSKGSTTLDPNHKYLYVLLEAIEDEGTADCNYTLPQSSITRRIDYSNPDYALSNMGLALRSYDFYFVIGAHTKTSCTGHTWNHSDNDDSCDNYETNSTYGTCNCRCTHIPLTV